ncbi:MAG: DNA polymerase III subunit gamma/tau [Candidatus Buchananbacteria bacterium]
MGSALYRKYRPQTFAQMIGQNHIKITLQHQLERGESAHAYLFCGPRGLGKTTSARLFAKSINCEKRVNGESEPCNACPSCLDIMAGRSVDIIEIDAASNTGVDNVRENIIENSRFTPVKSKYKVFIIDEAHMLSNASFNALLKIMEEPPAHVLFILCTTEIHKLPLTIISRCQRFDFKKVTAEQLLKRLQLIVEGENKKVEEEVLKRIVVVSEGCVRDAESLLAKILSLGDDITLEQAEIVLPRSDFQIILDFVEYLAEKNAAAAVEHLNRLMEEGVDLSVFTENLLEFLRQMMLVKVNGRLAVFGLEFNDDLAENIKDLADKFSFAEIVEMVEIFSDKAKEIKQAPIMQFPLEIAVIRLVERVSCAKPDKIIFAAASAPAVAAAPTVPAAGKPAAVAPSVAIKKDTSTAHDKTETATVPASRRPAASQPTIAAAASQPTLDQNVSLADIAANWGQLINRLIKTNFSLGSLLRISQPLSCDKGVLQVAVTSLFYKNRLETQDNQKVVEDTLLEVAGINIRVKGVVSQTVVPLEVAIDYGEDLAVPSNDFSPPPVPPAPETVPPIRLDPTEDVLGML